MANSAFTPTVVQQGIGVVQPGVADGLVSLNGVPGRPSGSVPTGYMGEDQYASLTSIFTKNPAGNNVWEDIPGSNITIASSGKFLLTVDVPTYFSISGGNTNSNYVIQASIRTSGPTVISSSAWSVYVSAGSLINPSLITLPITGIVTATTGQSFFLSVRYFYGGGAADAGTKEVGARGDTNNYVFKALRCG
jgi:hypothetical protein